MATVVVLLFFGDLALLGVLIIAWVIAMQYGDSSASYKLFAVRDKLIRLDILGAVSAEDPWYDRTYRDVNTILWCSNALAGLKGWAIARISAQQAAERRICEEDGTMPKTFKERLPDTEPNEALKPIFIETQEALAELRKNHIGWISFLNIQGRHYEALRKQRAKKLNELVDSGLKKLVATH